MRLRILTRDLIFGKHGYIGHKSKFGQKPRGKFSRHTANYVKVCASYSSGLMSFSHASAGSGVGGRGAVFSLIFSLFLAINYTTVDFYFFVFKFLVLKNRVKNSNAHPVYVPVLIYATIQNIYLTK